MTRKPITPRAQLGTRIVLITAIVSTLFVTVTSPYDWRSMVSFVLVAACAIMLLVSEVLYRRDRRDGRV
jgi:hypothetical protein